MPAPVFYFARLTRWDKITIAIYSLLTAGLWYYFVNTPEYSHKRVVLYVYAFWTHLMLYGFNYKSLRNLAVYLIWFAFAFLHLFVYFQLRGNPMLQSFDSDAATGLRNTIVLLLLFQVLRYVSIRIQGQELVCPSRSGTDLFDGRKFTFTDFILFAVYIGSVFALHAID